MRGTKRQPRPSRPPVRNRPLEGATRPPTRNRLLERLAPGTSLGQVARAVDLNIEYVSRIFNRKRTPSLRAAQRIAKFLGMPLDELAGALRISQRQR